MASDVSLVAALAAGALSFLSPCVLPLVPPYLVYLAGTSLELAEGAEPRVSVRRDTVVAAALFVLGFSTVFILLGAGASVAGGLVRAYSNELAIIAGIAIIVMGLHFLGLTRISWLMREKRAAMPKPVGLWGAYGMGLAFAFGWTPCRSGSAFPSCWPRWRSSRSRRSFPASARILPRSRRRWAASSC